MGEFADMAAAESVDSYWGNGRGDGISFWPSEHQAGKSLHPIARQRPKTCRRCGKGFLFWHNDNGHWRLHHYALLDGESKPRFVLHHCGYDSAGKPIPAPVDERPSGLRPEGAQGRSPASAVLSESEAGAQTEAERRLEGL